MNRQPGILCDLYAFLFFGLVLFGGGEATTMDLFESSARGPQMGYRSASLMYCEGDSPTARLKQRLK